MESLLDFINSFIAQGIAYATDADLLEGLQAHCRGYLVLDGLGSFDVAIMPTDFDKLISAFRLYERDGKLFSTVSAELSAIII